MLPKYLYFFDKCVFNIYLRLLLQIYQLNYQLSLCGFIDR